MSKSIGDRITWVEDKGVLSISISGRIEKWKESLLFFWILAWTFCGIYVAVQLFGDYPRDTKLAFAVYLVFWVYFQFKVGYAWLWRRWGKEYIKIDSESFRMKRDIRTYGKAHHCYIENIKSLSRVDYSKNHFLRGYNNSFWTIGGESLSFEYLSKKIGFGLQLNERDATELMRLVKEHLRKMRSQLQKGN